MPSRRAAPTRLFAIPCMRARSCSCSAPLCCGSWIGLALAPILVVAFAFRAVFEERTLPAQLPEYAEYAARVRYRFVPLIW